MLKIILGLLLISTNIFAADIYTGISEDYDQARSPWLSQHNVVASVKADFGKFGAIDTGLALDRIVTDTTATGTGFEVGYSNTLHIKSLSLVGRVGFSQLEFHNVQFVSNNIKGTFTGYTSNWNYSI